MKIHPALYRKIILSFSIPVIFFFSLEFILRMSSWNERLGPHRFDGGLEDHSLFWNPDNIIKIPIDEHRKSNEFRGRIFSVDKPEDTCRIICLGGSFTYGWPYNDEPALAYPSLLEDTLNSKHSYRKYEVINAGIGGYTSYQALFYFKHKLYKFNPDIIALCFGANDSNNNYEIGLFCSDKEYYRRLMSLALNRPLFGVKKFFDNLSVYALMETVIFHIKKTFIKPTQRVPPADFEENLEEFINLAERYDFKLLFIIEPHRNLRDFHKEIGENPYYSIMHRLAVKNQKRVKLVDTVSMVRKYKDSDIFHDIMHLTPFGHEKISELVYHSIKDSGYIK